MGYMEFYCQICGVSFEIGRVRCANEPSSAAWGMHFHSDCEAEGCQNVMDLDENDESEEILGLMEHLAGPDCTNIYGYAGSRISAAEMKVCA